MLSDFSHYSIPHSQNRYLKKLVCIKWYPLIASSKVVRDGIHTYHGVPHYIKSQFVFFPTTLLEIFPIHILHVTRII